MNQLTFSFSFCNKIIYVHISALSVNKNKKHLHFLLIYYIILFAHSKQHERIKNEGLSPNGKATDSDSVIFQVRILVALLQTPKENSSGVFVITAQKGCRVAEPSDSCYNKRKREHSQYRRKDGYVYI